MKFINYDKISPPYSKILFETKTTKEKRKEKEKEKKVILGLLGI
jgi:hypothetical protein